MSTKRSANSDDDASPKVPCIEGDTSLVQTDPTVLDILPDSTDVVCFVGIDTDSGFRKYYIGVEHLTDEQIKFSRRYMLAGKQHSTCASGCDPILTDIAIRFYWESTEEDDKRVGSLVQHALAAHDIRERRIYAIVVVYTWD